MWNLSQDVVLSQFLADGLYGGPVVVCVRVDQPGAQLHVLCIVIIVQNGTIDCLSGKMLLKVIKFNFHSDLHEELSLARLYVSLHNIAILSARHHFALCNYCKFHNTVQ